MKDKIDEIMGLVDDVVENAELLAKSSKHYAAFCASKKTIESKLRELEKDAARYRWLKNKGRCNDFRVEQEKTGWATTHSANSLDAAIDTAMQKD